MHMQKSPSATERPQALGSLTRAQPGGVEFRGLNFAQGVFVVLMFPPADHCATNLASLFSGPTVWGVRRAAIGSSPGQY